MAQRETVPTSINDYGAEEHPAFGQIKLARVSYGGRGAVLFDSDIKHQHTVRLTVTAADRRRDLHHDWIHGASMPLIEVEMSEAQWASFVSSMGTSGVSCTVRATETDHMVPDLAYDPRLAHSMNEVKDTADRLFAEAKDALADLEEAFTAKAGVRVLREKLRTLHHRLHNTESNMAFAAESLSEHAENVVQKARADIEAMVVNKAAQLGLSAGDTAEVLELPVLPGEARAIES
jgi:hypothetical protein